MNIALHNLAAMNVQRQLNIVGRDRAKSTEKLSSGYRINRAADDAAGLAISEKMRWMIRGLSQGSENTQDGISYVQIGDGAMGEIHDMLHRMEELSVKAANGTLTDDDRGKIDEEIQHLKQQINHIGKTTVFNEEPIFDNSTSVTVVGAPNDISFFDAYYDDTTGAYGYGGFLFQGKRVAWDQVAADMVDPNTGLFTGGQYQYSSGGTTFTISTEKDGVVPEITRTMKASASASGVVIDGKRFGWDKLWDEAGNMASDDNMHGGAWSLDYCGATVSFYIAEEVKSLSELASAITNLMDDAQPVHYVWEEKYEDDEPEQATDVVRVNDVRISQPIADAMIKAPGFSLSVKASEQGICLVDKDGNVISQSEKTWAQMGIGSWESGSDIKSGKNYTYSYGDAEGTALSFVFQLSDHTSVDSVIDGLDGMKISAKNIRTNYTTQVENTASCNKASVTGSINVDFAEEYRLGRDFGQKAMTIATENVTYNSANHTANLNFDNGSNTVISLQGNTSYAENALQGKIDSYISHLASVKEKSLLLGMPYQVNTLEDVLGASNITTAGYFDQVITITSAMQLTQGTHTFPPGSVGNSYPAAFIDFGSLSDASKVLNLAGTGFDSTCKTCSNHYSVSFVNAIDGGAYTTDGYHYKYNRNGLNHVLEVDVSSLVDKGVSNGADLAAAFVKIANGVFDFHYTQYAAQGSKLYVYDDRAQSSSAPQADFWTAPYNDDKMVNLSVRLNDSASDGSYLDMAFTYDIEKAADECVDVVALVDANGSYVKNSELTNDPTKQGYSLYDDASMNGKNLQRYRFDTVYKDANGTATSKNAAVSSKASAIVKDLLTATTVKLSSRDYTKAAGQGNENDNVAMAPIFASNVYRVGKEDGIDIVHSGIAGDKTFIPRFAMNTSVLGIAGVSTKTARGAQKTIAYLKFANHYLSEKRSVYGTAQNRLEHTLKNNQNKEENMVAAESKIRDTDMASEMVRYTKNNILAQAGQAMLAQANQNQQGLLSMLQ